MQVLSYISFVLTLSSLLPSPRHGFDLKLFNDSKVENDDQWKVAAATWYGEPEGAGSDGEFILLSMLILKLTKKC